MKLLDSQNKEITELDFGNVEIDNTKTIVCFLENDSEAFLEQIKIKVSNEEVAVSLASSFLDPFKKAKVEFTWTPSLKERKGLKADVSIEVTQIWK